MPQASDADREDMVRRFGSIDTEGPEKFLRDRGYTLSRTWLWSKPGVTTYGAMQRDEFDCLKFLMHEWDYGGLEGDPKC